MITDEQARQIGEDFDPMATALYRMTMTLRTEVHHERARMNGIVFSQQSGHIESLKKQIDEKNKEIAELQIAMEKQKQKNLKSKMKS